MINTTHVPYKLSEFKQQAENNRLLLHFFFNSIKICIYRKLIGLPVSNHGIHPKTTLSWISEHVNENKLKSTINVHPEPGILSYEMKVNN